MSDQRVIRILLETVHSGWLAWSDTTSFLLPPTSTTPVSYDYPEGRPALEVFRKEVMQSSFWEKLVKHYTSENHSEVIIQDNASCVKSICQCLLFYVGYIILISVVVQVLHAEPFNVLKPTLETLLANKDKNQQRGAAELLAGIVCGE
jgi:proteasome activator subunit 4